MTLIRRIQTLKYDRAHHERYYNLMGEALLFQTNDPSLLQVADEAFSCFPELPSQSPNHLVVRLFVKDGDISAVDRHKTERPVPIYHTQEYLFQFGLDSANTAIVDLKNGFAFGYVTPDIASDHAYLRVTFIEAMALSMLGTSRGYAYLHAACLIKDGVSLLLQAKGGTGKSTLAFACVRRGYQILSEDIVYIRFRPQGDQLWGLPWKLHLLPESKKFFPELSAYEPHLQLNGKWKLEIDLQEAFPAAPVACAPPGPMLLLERCSHAPSSLEPICRQEMLENTEFIWTWGVGWTDEMEHNCQGLLDAGTYRLQMNGSPDQAVDVLDQFVLDYKAGLQ